MGALWSPSTALGSPSPSPSPSPWPVDSIPVPHRREFAPRFNQEHAGTQPPGDDIAAQTAKTIDYLADVLQKAGTDLKHVVKATVFLADLDEWGRFNEVWKKYFPTDKPVRTTTEVGKFGGHTRIEIDFVAVMPD